MRPPILFNTVSPQTPLVDEACAWLALELALASPAPPLRRVRELVTALADAQPAMAAFLSLGTRLLAVADKAALEEAPPAEITARVQAALAAWQADFVTATESVARQAQAVMPASGWVATTTRSSLVEKALVLAHEEGRPVHALLSESRPMNEGKGLATALAGRGIDTWFAVDGALPLLLPQAGAFLVGADAVREKSFLAKAGTYALLGSIDESPTEMSITGLAISPGTEVEPMCSIRTTCSPSAARRRAASRSKRTGHPGSGSTIAYACVRPVPWCSAFEPRTPARDTSPSNKACCAGSSFAVSSGCHCTPTIHRSQSASRCSCSNTRPIGAA